VEVGSREPLLAARASRAGWCDERVSIRGSVPRAPRSHGPTRLVHHIFGFRPLGCRLIEPGDARCRQYRRERGSIGERPAERAGAQPVAPMLVRTVLVVAGLGVLLATVGRSVDATRWLTADGLRALVGVDAVVRPIAYVAAIVAACSCRCRRSSCSGWRRALRPALRIRLRVERAGARHDGALRRRPDEPPASGAPARARALGLHSTRRASPRAPGVQIVAARVSSTSWGRRSRSCSRRRAFAVRDFMLGTAIGVVPAVALAFSPPTRSPRAPPPSKPRSSARRWSWSSPRHARPPPRRHLGARPDVESRAPLRPRTAATDLRRYWTNGANGQMRPDVAGGTRRS